MLEEDACTSPDRLWSFRELYHCNSLLLVLVHMVIFRRVFPRMVRLLVDWHYEGAMLVAGFFVRSKGVDVRNCAMLPNSTNVQHSC